MSHRFLVIDTATTACSVALFENDKLVASYFEDIGRGHAEKLVPMIAQLPDKGRADKIFVNCGPGSFTGVRIGLSAAKALALAWQAEIAGYQCLALVAAQALQNMIQQSPVYVAMLGGHGEYFVQNFESNGHASDALLSLVPDAAQKNRSAEFYAGSAAAQLASLTDDATFETILPDAAQILALPQNYEYLPTIPIYGRAPDAQPQDST